MVLVEPHVIADTSCHRTSIRQCATPEYFHVMVDCANAAFVMTRHWKVKWREHGDVVIVNFDPRRVCKFGSALKFVEKALFEMYHSSTISDITHIDDSKFLRLKNWYVNVYDVSDFVSRKLQR
jgi:hypothetical protein